MTEPLPCPFCGNNPTIVRALFTSQVKCDSQDCLLNPRVTCTCPSDSQDSERTAIRYWNTRAPVPGSLDARIAKLDPLCRDAVLNTLETFEDD
jgi:hypothetical protein